MQAALEGGAATSRPVNRDACGGGVIIDRSSAVIDD